MHRKRRNTMMTMTMTSATSDHQKTSLEKMPLPFKGRFTVGVRAARKPNFVPSSDHPENGDDHSSKTAVAGRL